MTETQHALKITPTSINAIHEAEDNPRIISPRAVNIVANSINRFGWKQPIVTTTDGEIIAGHTRYRAAKQLGHTTVPVHVADNLTPDEVRAYRIADNRSGDFSSWDIPQLVDEIAELEGSFDEELALEDWDQIMAEYDEAVTEYTEGTEDTAPPPERDTAAPRGTDAPEESKEGGDAPALSTTLPPDTTTYMRGHGHELTVIFDSDDNLLAGRQALLDMPGVIDVQNKRSF